MIETALGEAKHVDVDGVRTRYFERGTGTPLVLVHGGHYGGLNSAEDWELNAGLSEHFRLICVDKLGMGHTDPPSEEDQYLIAPTVQHLRRFLETIGAEGAWLAGHSRGGYAVTRLVLDHPSFAAGLVIVSSGTTFSTPNPELDQWRREALELTEPIDRIRYQMSRNSYRDDHISASTLAWRLQIAELDKTKHTQKLMDNGGYQRFKDDLGPQQQEAVRWIEEGRLDLPTLLIWGFNDPSARMDRAGIPAMQAVLANVEGSEMHIVGQAGHYVFREQPRAFDDAVTSYIQRHTNGR